MAMKNPRHQNFSFRWPIMKYIAKSPKAWKKLIRTCKYFFAKYPVYPVEDVTIFYGCWNADRKIIDKTKNVSKLWISGVFKCNLGGGPTTVSRFISKIVKCELYYLQFWDQTLTWEDYQILTASGSIKHVYLYYCAFKYSCGEDVTMDKLLENLRDVEVFKFTSKFGSKMFEKDTVNKIGEILSGFKSIRTFFLNNLAVNFDLSSFMNFLMKNETVSVYLQFLAPYSHYPAAFAQMLDTCFEKLVSNPLKKPVDISIYGFQSDKYRKYSKIRDGRN